ncbi:MAG TPA: serine--tRNA ligase [Nevskiaceae bacterium]|nr:serine--tRNA ligase [Nevskiaceae bacterium]
MLDINLIRENPKKVTEGTKNKGCDSKIVNRVLKVDETRRQLIAEVERWRQQRNKLSKKDVEKGKKIKEMLRRLEPDLRAVEEQLQNLLAKIPNLPADDVPVGKDESGNVEIKKWGKPKKFTFKPKSHFELGESLDLIDTKRAAKVSGTRFGYLKNEAVWLELALVRLAFETLTKEGFKPVIPPVMISLNSMKGMGYLEHGGQEDMYVLDKDNLVLVGTSEQAIGPMHKDEVFQKDELPRRYIAFSTCFRREAGSYGKDTKGILRVHQFNKVEMFSFVKPKDSDKEHEYLLSLEEKLMKTLKLPYRVVKMCTGDLGAPVARKYDIEAWFPSEKSYRETHSTSTCTDFQARGLNIKFKKKEGNLGFIHTLNGTVFSERPILAILENYQQKDGSVLVPEVLQKYTGFKKIAPKR